MSNVKVDQTAHGGQVSLRPLRDKLGYDFGTLSGTPSLDLEYDLQK